MEPKKISFSFNKPIKRTNVFANIPHPDTSKPEKELISCLEGQSIKLLNEKIKEPEKPLVIPLKERTISSAALVSMKTRKDVLNGADSVVAAEELNKPVTEKPEIPENESIEQKAARELIEEIREKNGKETEDASLIVPVKPNDLHLDGANGSTMDDYENIPVSQFGYAMIRGMGWKGVPKEANAPDDDDLLIRPKGMGLGAGKMLKSKQPLLPPEENEKLQININSFVRILAGKYKDLYGQIEALDEISGRLIIKLALKGNKESFDEFMVQPVSKSEYTQYAKVINSAKYEEYKKMENEHGQIIIKKEEKDVQIKTENVTVKVKKDDHHTDDKRSDADRKSRLDKSSHYDEYKSEDRKERSSHSKKSSRRHSSDVEEISSSKHKEQNKYHEQKSRSRHGRDDHKRSESTDSSNSSKERNTKKKSKKHKSRDRSKYSRSPSQDDKRHKKKTKKSKRPRSRSKGRR